MNVFSEIIEKIKDIVSLELGNRFVFDKDVANLLKINQKSFATMKARNKIPYKQIMEFCAKRKISINYVFFNQKIKIEVNMNELKIARKKEWEEIINNWSVAKKNILNISQDVKIVIMGGNEGFVNLGVHFLNRDKARYMEKGIYPIESVSEKIIFKGQNVDFSNLECNKLKREKAQKTIVENINRIVNYMKN